MSDPLKDLQTRLQQETADADRQLLRSIREAKTEEGLREEWDRWRGKSGRPQSRQAGWWKELSELWVALSSARIPQRVAYTVGTIAVLLVAWWQLVPSPRSFRTPPEGLIAGGLPGTLQVKLQSGKSSLMDAGRTLSALLNSPRRGGGLSVFDVDYSGTDAQGNQVSFKGSMVITNAVGVGTLTSDKDITGILLDGDLTVGTLPPTKIRQSFIP